MSLKDAKNVVRYSVKFDRVIQESLDYYLVCGIQNTGDGTALAGDFFSNFQATKLLIIWFRELVI